MQNNTLQVLSRTSLSIAKQAFTEQHFAKQACTEHHFSKQSFAEHHFTKPPFTEHHITKQRFTVQSIVCVHIDGSSSVSQAPGGKQAESSTKTPNNIRT